MRSGKNIAYLVVYYLALCLLGQSLGYAINNGEIVTTFGTIIESSGIEAVWTFLQFILSLFTFQIIGIPIIVTFLIVYVPMIYVIADYFIPTLRP